MHRFLADYRDTIAWTNDMKNIINADELAKDVPGAEALMERHQEHKVGKVEGHREGISRTWDVDVNVCRVGWCELIYF